MYLSNLNRMTRPGANAPETGLLGVFNSLRNEGIADLVDKPYPLMAKSTAMAEYAKSYNDTYARTPAIVRSIDSLIAIAARDSTKLQSSAQAARAILPWNAHPTGAYMARTVYEAFGVDSLFPAIGNPFAFLRLFREAEAKQGRTPPFSAVTIAWLDSLEKRYIQP